MELQTVNQVSKMLGVSTQMLRYYERSGLVKSLRKEDYAYRVYDEENMKRLQQIVILRKLQIPIKQIALILNNPDAATATEIFNKNIADIQNEITALQTIKLALEIFVAKIEELATVRLNLNLLTDEAVMELADKLSLTQKNVKENITMSELSKAAETMDRARKDVVRVVHYPTETIAYLVCKNADTPSDSEKTILEKFVRDADLIKIKPDFKCMCFGAYSSIFVTIPDDLDVPAPLTKGTFHGGFYAAVTVMPNNKNSDDPFESIDVWLQNNDDYMNDQGQATNAAIVRPSCSVFFNPLNIYNLKNTNQFDAIYNTNYYDFLVPIREKEKVTDDMVMTLAKTEQGILHGKTTEVNLETMIKKDDFELNFIDGKMVMKSTRDYHNGMVTSQQFKCPMKIELRAMTDKTDIIINYIGTLNVRAGDFNKPLVYFEQDKLSPFSTKDIPKNEFVNIEWILGREVMAIKVNGELHVLGSDYEYIQKIDEGNEHELIAAIGLSSARQATITVESLRITEI